MPTWMVVEDEPDLYDTLLMLFDIWGVDGVAFTDGADAIAWIEDVDRDMTDATLPELALLDIRLPGASGPEIGARLRKSPVLNNIAIVLATAYYLTPREERDAMTLSQADTLIYKPLPKPAELREMLQQTIAERPARAPAKPAAPQPAPSPAAPAPSRLASTDASRVPTPRRVVEPMPEPATPEPRAGWLRRAWRWLSDRLHGD